mmetsp:Transcript_90185/g.263732  ORF Transcript_90185/g.263732 Transcript_90185/m.263732 type:complete len:235 (+) Transcript_90185:361-1065(+)
MASADLKSSSGNSARSAILISQLLRDSPSPSSTLTSLSLPQSPSAPVTSGAGSPESTSGAGSPESTSSRNLPGKPSCSRLAAPAAARCRLPTSSTPRTLRSAGNCRKACRAKRPRPLPSSRRHRHFRPDRSRPRGPRSLVRPSWWTSPYVKQVPAAQACASSVGVAPNGSPIQTCRPSYAISSAATTSSGVGSQSGSAPGSGSRKPGAPQANIWSALTPSAMAGPRRGGAPQPA